MPGLPAFCRTRFNAAKRFRRSHAFSIRSLVPGRSFPFPAEGASTRKRDPCGFTAPAVCARTIVRRLWHGIPEGRGRLALPIVRPFAAGAATMASADFSLRRPCGPRHPFGRRARPPRVRTSAFAAPPPDLRRRALVTRASRSLARSPCLAPPHIRFLFVGPQPRSTLPSRRPRGPALCASLRSP